MAPRGSWIAIAAVVAVVAIVGGITFATACHASHPPPVPASAPAPPPAPRPPLVLQQSAAPVPPGAEDPPGGIDDVSEAEAAVLPAADAWRGKRVRRATAVVLFAAPRRADDDEPDTGRVFQPLVCSIAGTRATGARCGEAMPARATLRTPHGELVVTRSTRPFHDEAGEHDYPAPYGPACCMYNTCVGHTVPYRAARGAQPAADRHAILAVWPPDADVALEVASVGLAGVAADAVSIAGPRPRVDQAFVRDQRRYASVHGRGSAAVVWDVGAGWVAAGDGVVGPDGFTLLATTDVDHDGHLELISLERWANDYGLDVFGDAAPEPIYRFSCGNI